MRMQVKHDFHRKTDSLWYVVTSNNLLYRVEYVQGIHKQTVFHGLVPKYLTIRITHALEQECSPKLHYNLLWKIFPFLNEKDVKRGTEAFGSMHMVSNFPLLSISLPILNSASTIFTPKFSVHHWLYSNTKKLTLSNLDTANLKKYNWASCLSLTSLRSKRFCGSGAKNYRAINGAPIFRAGESPKTLFFVLCSTETLAT